jgi:hypothetical protein
LEAGDKFALPGDAHAGLAADAGEVVAEGDVEFGRRLMMAAEMCASGERR